MKKFDWKKFRNEKIAVHCKTEDEAKDFCQKMHEQGMKWADMNSFLKRTKYHTFQKNTCYSGGGYYCDYDYCKENEYTILEWSDYMRKEFTKADLKDGMVVEYRNGKRRIVVGDILYGQINHGKLDWYDENLLYSGEEAQVFNNLDIMKVYEVKYHRGFNTLFVDDNLRLIWEREETKAKRMTVEEMRQKLEELTGEKIEIEPSRGEMIARLYQYCDECSNCYTKCSIKRKCRTKGNFFNYDTEDLKQCYEKVMEDGK